MTSGGLTQTEGWNLQLQGRVRDLEADLASAEKHIATLTAFWMDNAGWTKACEGARAFLAQRAADRQRAQEQAATIDKFLAEDAS
jgi:hypothetical protein